VAGGAEVVADVVGGSDTLEAIRCTAPQGRVLILGFAGGSIAEVAVNRLLLRNIDLVGVAMGGMAERDPGLLRAGAARLTTLVDAGLSPLVGRTFPLAEGAQALRCMERREAVGKIVLVLF
jgi:NADPH2:quinone reductase